MFGLKESKRFSRKRKKLLKRNKNLRKSLLKTLKQLANDPTHQSLQSHKVVDIDGNISFSSRVNSDLRVIWDYSEDEINIIDLIDLGGHEGGKAVYG